MFQNKPYTPRPTSFVGNLRNSLPLVLDVIVCPLFGVISLVLGAWAIILYRNFGYSVNFGLCKGSTIVSLILVHGILNIAEATVGFIRTVSKIANAKLFAGSDSYLTGSLDCCRALLVLSHITLITIISPMLYGGHCSSILHSMYRQANVYVIASMVSAFTMMTVLIGLVSRFLSKSARRISEEKKRKALLNAGYTIIISEGNSKPDIEPNQAQEDSSQA